VRGEFHQVAKVLWKVGFNYFALMGSQVRLTEALFDQRGVWQHNLVNESSEEVVFVEAGKVVKHIFELVFSVLAIHAKGLEVA
jgi:hypothetical protein